MTDSDPSSLPSPSTREEARYVKNCIGCQQSVPIVAFTIEREPGPFCRDCWEALKLHVAQVNLLNIKADLKLAPSAPEAPTAEAARSASPQQEKGGPAFPQQPFQMSDGSVDYPLASDLTGMSLRDYFAAKAMAGFLTSCVTPGQPLNGAMLSTSAYELADVMLAERGRHVAATFASDSEAERAGMDDGLLAAQARIAELEADLATLRSTHATLQSALRQYGRHDNDCPAAFRLTLSEAEKQAGWRTEDKPCDCGFQHALNLRK